MIVSGLQYDTTDSEWELHLEVNNRSSNDYTIVPGTDMTLAGTGGTSLDLLNQAGPGTECYNDLHDGDVTVIPGRDLHVLKPFCFASPGTFRPANIQIQGSTPATYTIKLAP